MSNKSYTYKRAEELTVGDQLVMENHGFVGEPVEDSCLIKQKVVQVEVGKVSVYVKVEDETEWYVMTKHSPIAVSGLIVDEWWSELFMN